MPSNEATGPSSSTPDLPGGPAPVGATYHAGVFSVSPAEILTIAVVALLVFGPKRLPEIARKAGKVIREIRTVADDLKSGLEAEYADTIEPLKDARDTMKDAIAGVERSVAAAGPSASLPDSGPEPGPDPDAEGPSGSDDEAAGSGHREGDAA